MRALYRHLPGLQMAVLAAYIGACTGLVIADILLICGVRP